ncbi:MAG: DUF4351 domain-containing protein [Thermostichus sp. BF3_bins_97]
MLQRLYIHNFRCLENFELFLKGISSALLIGRNGVGKSTIADSLELFQSIGRGVNRVGQLIQPKDFAPNRSNIPIRFEIETLLEDNLYKYVLALELPQGFRELRVFEEQLLVSGEPVYSRREAQVTLASRNREAQFLVDWHLIALPVIQEQSERDPQEGLQARRQAEAATLVIRQLRRRYGILEPELATQVSALTTEQLESLAEALLDFTQLADLQEWLAANVVG